MPGRSSSGLSSLTNTHYPEYYVLESLSIAFWGWVKIGRVPGPEQSRRRVKIYFCERNIV